MRKAALVLGSLAGLLIAVAFLARGDSVTRADVGGMTAMSLDMDTTGNTATSVGAIDVCVHAIAGDAVTVDVTAQGIPPTTAMIAFAATISYDKNSLSVTANNVSMMLNANSGSQIFDTSDAVPDTDGTFNFGAIDTGSGTGESGDGVLARTTITVSNSAVSGYLYNVNLSNGAHIDSNNMAYAPNAINGARIAVGSATCTDTFKKGDVDCNNLINSADALKVLRFAAGLSVNQAEPCTDVGSGTPKNGDINCNGSVNSVDALLLLRHNAGLSVTLPPGCAAIGT